MTYLTSSIPRWLAIVVRLSSANASLLALHTRYWIAVQVCVMVAVGVAGADLIRATGFIVAIVVIAFGRVPHHMNDRIDIS
jgi:hypothetical protein